MHLTSFAEHRRLLTRRAILWTEMTVAETLVHRSQHNSLDETDIQLDRDLMRHCGWFDERDHCDGGSIDMIDPHPIVCQIGTNNPTQAAFATRVVNACGYDRIDLNSECPSDRVSGREFGAALMKDKDTAIDVIRSMVHTSESFEDEMTLPVSIKTRIGVDDFDSFEHLVEFVECLIDAGCKRFVIHARKVYTQGLSPAQNRTVPPLNYPFVYQLIERFPQCDFWLNG
jgi:tRNA-dihydrouridine synthase A